MAKDCKKLKKEKETRKCYQMWQSRIFCKELQVKRKDEEQEYIWYIRVANNRLYFILFFHFHFSFLTSSWVLVWCYTSSHTSHSHKARKNRLSHSSIA